MTASFGRTAFVAAVSIAACLVAAITRPAAAAEPPRPDIILIMVDDMGWSDIGCYGGEVNTPNLDRLAAGGMRFTQFYNCAKCNTTRAALLTGLHPRRAGLRQTMVTLGEVLGVAGYQTVLTGKWHLGGGQTTHPYKRGFDEYYGLLDGCCNFFNPAQRDPKFKGSRLRKFGHNDQIIKAFPEDYYTTDAFTDHAIKTIEKFAKNDKPFFLHLCYTAPHYPLHAKPEDIAKYKGKYKMGWEEMRRQRYRRQVEMGLVDPATAKLSATDSRSYDWGGANQEWEDLRMAVYAAMIDSVDQNLGRLFKKLDELKVTDNTLVMFLADNGGCAEEPGGRNMKAIPGPKEYYTAVGPAWGWAQNAPFRRYKANMHEGGICTPLIAHWPGNIKPGQITHQPGHIIDFMATFIDLAGTEYPRTYNGHGIIPLEGKSLLPILKGETRQPHKTLYWEYGGSRAIRQGDWKLVWNKKIKQWSLFNLAVDRTETNDLAAQHADRVDAMSKLWIAWNQEMKAPVQK